MVACMDGERNGRGGALEPELVCKFIFCAEEKMSKILVKTKNPTKLMRSEKEGRGDFL